MLGIYYRVWFDLINRARLNPEKRSDWKTMTTFYMTMAMSLNLWLLVTIAKKFYLPRSFYLIRISGFPDRINNILTFLLFYILPCLVLNSLLILRDNRYMTLMKKYAYRNENAGIVYIVLSFLLPLLFALGMYLV